MTAVKNFDDIEKSLENMSLKKDSDFFVNDKDAIGDNLSFFLPHKNFAINICPLGDSSKDKYFNKAISCEKNGIELISLFDWIPEVKVVEMLDHRIKGSSERIGARKCQVHWIEKGSLPKLEKEIKDFLNSSHILGFRPMSIEGYVILTRRVDGPSLFKDDELIGAMAFGKRKKLASFSKQRATKVKEPPKGQIELLRMVFKPGLSVPGGASKMLSEYKRTHRNVVSEIVTFSDFDLGHGSVYGKIGFDLIAKPEPQLLFVHPTIRKKDGSFWKIKQTSLVFAGSDRLLANFPGYQKVGLECKCAHPEGTPAPHPDRECLPTNQEIVKSYGFVEAWDCGYKKWLMKI